MQTASDVGSDSSAGCLSDDDAAGFVAGELDADHRRAAAEHLDRCDLCRRVVSALAGTPASTDGTATLPAATPAAELDAGDTLGRFTLNRVVGHGAMGDVWAAHDPALDREVALKLLRLRPGAIGVEATIRLRREAQAMARVSHPNIVAIYELGTDDDRVFCAMELIAGVTLRRWLAVPRSWQAVLDVARQIGIGIAAAHAAGLVHRDIKPENILIADDGRVLVSDFGLAKLVALGTEAEPEAAVDRAPDQPVIDAAGSLEALTATGAVIGTPAYMAPEQLSAHRVDARSDQFSYAATIYEALFGARPFAGDTLTALAADIRRGPRPPADAHGVPRGVVRGLLRALAVDPAARWPTVAALVDELDRSARRPRQLRIAAAAIAVLAAVTAAAAWLPSGPDPLASEQAAERAAASQRIAAVWNPAKARTLQAAFAKTASPVAADNAAVVVRQLDAYRDSWLGQRLDAWSATHVRRAQTPESLERRLVCFDALADAMDGLVALLIAGDPRDIETAPQIAYRLQPVASCGNLERLMARSPPPSTPDGKQAERKLRELETLQIAGHHAEVLDRAHALVDEAQRLGDPMVLARARYALGASQANGGHLADAEATLHLAVQDAAAARDHYLVADAWLRLLNLTGNELRHLQAAQAMEPAVRAAVAQAGDDPRQRADLALALGTLAYSHGDLVTARDQYVIARERRIAARGPDHPAVAIDESNLGAVLGKLGDNAEATRHLERALAIVRGSLGERQPVVAQIEQNMADIANHGRDWVAGERHARTAIAVNIAVRGADNPLTARCRVVLAHSLREQRRFADARAEVAQARTSMARSLPNGHPRQILLDLEEAYIADLEGNADEAVRLARRAVDGLRQHEAAASERAYAISSLAMFVARRTPGDALPLYDEALELYMQQAGHDLADEVDELRELSGVALRAHRPAAAIRWFERMPEAAKRLTGERAQLDREARAR